MQFAERVFMENLEKIVNNQKKINELMSKYEEITRKLIECEIDEILSLVDKRNDIALKISRLNNEILSCFDENSVEYMAYKNTCSRDELSDELKIFFDLRQTFYKFAVQIQSMNPEITERIKIEKDKLLKKIKDNNSGQTAKAAKFYNAGFSQGDKLFFPKNNRRI